MYSTMYHINEYSFMHVCVCVYMSYVCVYKWIFKCIVQCTIQMNIHLYSTLWWIFIYIVHCTIHLFKCTIFMQYSFTQYSFMRMHIHVRMHIHLYSTFIYNICMNSIFAFIRVAFFIYKHIYLFITKHTIMHQWIINVLYAWMNIYLKKL